MASKVNNSNKTENLKLLQKNLYYVHLKLKKTIHEATKQLI